MRSNGNELSVPQITYLENIKRLQEEGKRCTVGKVAAMSNVTHAPVSRFMKECAVQGYLDGNNCLTESGRILLKRQRILLDNVREYVKELGMEGEQLEESVKNLIENVDTPLLNLIMERERRRKKFDQIWGNLRYGGEIPADTVKELFLSGRYEVEFRLFRLSGEEGLSMADHGFEKPASFKKNRNEAWLELKRKPMQARSGKDGHIMTGQMESLRYEDGGVLKDADIKGDVIRIPLEVFRFAGEGQKEFVGILPVTVTCSVGHEHMPENTAMMVVWL